MSKRIRSVMSIAMALIASFSLVFSSCSNASSSKPNQSEDDVVSVDGDIVLSQGSYAKAYDTITEAVAYIQTNGASGEEWTITVKPGTYNENYIHYNGAATVKIYGSTTEQYGADVIITGHGENMGKEKGRELVEFEGTGNLILENVTLLSDYSRASVSGDAQAEVLGFDSTGYVAAYNCSFKSHQDTMRTTGKGWFYKCYIEGDTDFIWMESAGVVALYEECEIVSVYDEYASTHASYILAPRANVANVIGKGAVIFNSTVKLQNDTNLLFRNPWGTNTNYYNQGAFIGCTFEGEISSGVAKSAAMGTADQQYVGWKLDFETTNSYGIGLVSDEVKTNEYSGRRAILNRNYNVKYAKFEKDSAALWDVDTFINKQGWNVTEDTSSVLLAGEEDNEVVVYNFDGSEDFSALCSGFALESGKTHYVGQAGSTISIPVTGKATISVTGYYAGTGTISVADQGAGKYNVKNGSTSKYITVDYVNYTEGLNTVIITADSTSYITKVTVTYDSSITFNPVTSIDVSAAEGATEMYGKKTLQMSASVNPSNASNTDFEWSVSDESVATIDSDGVLTAADVEAESLVEVYATAMDGAGAIGSYTVKVLPLSASSVDLVWLDNTEASFVGSTSNETLAIAGDAVPVTSSTEGTEGTWAYNSSKLSGMGVTLTTTDADPTKGEWFIEYPVTAGAEKDLKLDTVKIYWGNPGTSNLRTYVTFVDASDVETVLYDNDSSTKLTEKTPDGGISPRSSDNASSEYAINKVLAAGTTGKVRICIHGYQDGAFKQTFSGKTPTWGKTIISATAGTFPIEGQSYSWDLRKTAGTTSYTTPDELLSVVSASSNNGGHGYIMKAGNSFTVYVAGNVNVTVLTCAYDNAQEITVTTSDGTVIGTIATAGDSSNDADESHVVEYTGAMDVLTFTYTGSSGQNYLHGVKVTPISSN